MTCHEPASPNQPSIHSTHATSKIQNGKAGTGPTSELASQHSHITQLPRSTTTWTWHVTCRQGGGCMVLAPQERGACSDRTRARRSRRRGSQWLPARPRNCPPLLES
jgi:hypothetical protein